MTSLVFLVPPRLWLTSNRHHTNLGALSALRGGLHDLAALTVAQARPEPITGPVDAVWTIRYPKGVRTDKGEASNSQPTCKALLDGIVRAGVLPDDGPRWIASETYRRGPNLAEARLHSVALILTPADEESAS